MADGEQRSKCWTLGALKDALNRMRASCALMSASLFTALASSSHRFDQAESMVVPGKSGGLEVLIQLPTLEAKMRAQGL